MWTKYLFFIVITIGNTAIYSQTIPYGTSSDSLVIHTPTNTVTSEGAYHIYYYKPANYDSLNSPIWLAIHGTGGNGASMINQIKDIADRRNALIVSPTMHIGTLGWAYVSDGYHDTITNCTTILWSTQVFKQIYRHVLQRENRDSIPVYFTGFSQGAQFVSRYMLVRQFDFDSIPIRMSVSVNAANYTLCTDTFSGIAMKWTFYRCGLAEKSPIYACIIGGWEYIPVNQLICNSHVKQYYNENYGVLIGTLDTATFTGFCPNQGGKDRYERAIAFYNFSDTNAITRGTTLKWQYAEVPGVGHDGYAMYHTKAKPTDTSTIAETLLFDTPWHPVTNFLPKAKFSHADTALTVSFTDSSTNTTAWLWDFGDTSASSVQNPVHTYSKEGTYYVCLTVGDSCVSDTYCDSVNVIATGEKKFGVAGLEFTVFPNPSNGQFTLTIQNPQLIINNSQLIISNLLGQTVYQQTLNTKQETLNPELSKGMYFIQIENEGILLGSGKLMVQ